MSTSLDHLLPAEDEVLRCADFTRMAAVDPGGTAIRADRVLLVETSLPWPKPVFDHPTLGEINPLFKSALRPTRLLACRPPATAEGTPATQVWVFDRNGATTRERRFDVATPNELLALGSCLAAEQEGHEATSPQAPPPVYDGDMDGQAVLVCTQGSHDICCGADGERFAQDAERLGVADLRVFRVSHTGGHRFAPTAMTLPDGRMWAYMTPEMLSAILSRQGDTGPLSQYCRGWWGADVGPAQIAERAAWAASGFSFDDLVRSCREVEPMVYEVEIEGQPPIKVDVELVREMPTIACRKPGGLPTKIGREYRAEIRS